MSNITIYYISRSISQKLYKYLYFAHQIELKSKNRTYFPRSQNYKHRKEENKKF